MILPCLARTETKPWKISLYASLPHNLVSICDFFFEFIRGLPMNFEKSRDLSIVDTKCLKFFEISSSSSLFDAEIISAFA